MQVFRRPKRSSCPDAFQFAPDGRLLAVQSWGQIEILDTATGAWRLVHPSGEIAVRAGTAGVGFTADGRGVVYYRDRYSDEGLSTVLVRDFETDQDRVLLRGEFIGRGSTGNLCKSTVQLDGRIAFIALSPAEGSYEVVALDTATGERRFAFGRLKAHIRELAVSADGNWVVTSSLHDLRVWDLTGGKRPKRAKMSVHDNTMSHFGNLALSRDGRFVASGGDCAHGQVRLWDVKEARALPLGKNLRGGGVAFAPDRDLFAYTQAGKEAGEVVFRDAQTQAEVRRYDWDVGEIEAVAFSPDGCRCVTGGREKVVIWDVDV